MPTFSEYSELGEEFEVDISVDEFFEEMNAAECREMQEALIENGFILPTVDGRGYDAIEFEEAINRLVNNYHQLTRLETETIVGLAKRF